MRVAGVVLAGGRSSRMGTDKAFVRIAGRPLWRWSVERMARQVAAVAVNANGEASRFDGPGISVIADTLPGFPGPLAGILAAMEWAAVNGWDAAVTVAVDTPFFPADLVSRLADEADAGRPAAARSGERVHPVLALWPCRLRGALQNFLDSGETGRVMTFLDRCRFAAVDFPPLELSDGGKADPFFNVNTPADLDRAEAIAEVLRL